MSKMLRKTHPDSCCLSCDRRRNRVKPGERARERRLARKREKREWISES